LKIRAADAKEVGVGNPAEETCCYPNKEQCDVFATICQQIIVSYFAFEIIFIFLKDFPLRSGFPCLAAIFTALTNIFVA
jgi:hypothetical protein